MTIFLSSLHIKLWVVKGLVKAMAKTHSKGFQYLSKKFPNISTAKVKEVIFWDLKANKSWKITTM
jgi:hypothetical protein